MLCPHHVVLLLLLQLLAHTYDLHPLAVEDVLHFQRIKAVTYSGAWLAGWLRHLNSKRGLLGARAVNLHQDAVTDQTPPHDVVLVGVYRTRGEPTCGCGNALFQVFPPAGNAAFRVAETWSGCTLLLLFLLMLLLCVLQTTCT
jgi:hypothetical protein